jgi:hypothetical protein
MSGAATDTQRTPVIIGSLIDGSGAASVFHTNIP